MQRLRSPKEIIHFKESTVYLKKTRQMLIKQQIYLVSLNYIVITKFKDINLNVPKSVTNRTILGRFLLFSTITAIAHLWLETRIYREKNLCILSPYLPYSKTSAIFPLRFMRKYLPKLLVFISQSLQVICQKSSVLSHNCSPGLPKF